MFLNLCKFGKSLLFPCKFVLLSAYCRQINVLSTPQPKPFGNISPGAVCSAPRERQLHFSRGLHERVREMLKADGMKKVWVLWEKLLQVQVVAGPGGSANTPLGTRKPSQILGGPERQRLFPLLASERWALRGTLAICIRPPPCFTLHTLQNHLGARHISKSLTAPVFRPVESLVRSPLHQPATVKSLLA